MDFTGIYSQFKMQQLYGRYINLEDITKPLGRIGSFAEVKVIGNSVLGKPLYLCQVGTGKINVLLWSQMHGNESTTTKALFDLLNFLGSDTPDARKMLEKFTFFAVPMLNPDGALSYIRENAAGVDLNRDFCNLTQPESNALFQLFKEITPDYCYNLHDQRTIFGAGDSGKPATVSFLSPSYNEARDINGSRTIAINVIAAMNDILQGLIPGQVGRFDDSFNINCVGDTFQSHNIPTILFEAGHYPEDYQREETRKLIFVALLAGLKYIFDNVVVDNRITDYLNIPQNKVNFYDFVYKNVKINYDGIEKITNFAAQYREELAGNNISFNAYIAEVEIPDGVFGHKVYDAREQLYRGEGNIPQTGQKADFHLGDIEFINGEKIAQPVNS